MNTNIESVDVYIAQFPESVQSTLIQIRKLIFELVSDAKEKISYGMPAYKLNGKPLIYFAAYKNHIGFYATPSAHESFKVELLGYKQGKGSVQFPINDKIPFELIEKMILFKKSELEKLDKNPK